jgi:hypothetical protein
MDGCMYPMFKGIRHRDRFAAFLLSAATSEKRNIFLLSGDQRERERGGSWIRRIYEHDMSAIISLVEFSPVADIVCNSQDL